ncbi:MAG: MFS transporter [Candidatus Omnitrophota bacterium]
MTYIKLFLDNKRIISFGFLLTLFSSAGQTFFLSLYVNSILADFCLTNASFGLLYSSATILSAAALAFAGRFIDYYNLRTYALISSGLLCLSCVATALSRNIVVLFIGLWGLRFAGQGLLSHISSTSMAKFFIDKRGKALSVSVLGYAFGEGILPVIITGLSYWRAGVLR